MSGKLDAGGECGEDVDEPELLEDETISMLKKSSKAEGNEKLGEPVGGGWRGVSTSMFALCRCDCYVICLCFRRSC